MSTMPDDPNSDPFHPPEMPVEVQCLHCGEVYESWQIEWREELADDGQTQGFWCCPIDGCDGKGFGFDILPTDPDYQDERGGWVWEDEEYGEWDEDLEDGGGLSDPPHGPGGNGQEIDRDDDVPF